MVRVRETDGPSRAPATQTVALPQINAFRTHFEWNMISPSIAMPQREILPWLTQRDRSTYRLHTTVYRSESIIRVPILDHRAGGLIEQGIHRSQVERGSPSRGTLGLWEPMDEFQSSPYPSTSISG